MTDAEKPKPEDQEQPRDEQPKDVQSEKPPLDRKKILAVMSVQLIIRQLRKLLEPKYQLLETDQEITAIGLIKTEKPDLVFLDNNLRATDGIDIVRKMRQIGFTTPVIMSFNTISEKDVKDISDQNVTAHFTHPLDYDKIIACIEEVLAGTYVSKTRKEATGMSIKVGTNTLVCQAGDAGKECFVIQSGRVRVFRSLKNGQEHTLAELGPGDIFGEMAMVNPRPRTASVITLEETELFLLTRDNLLMMIRQKPEFALKLVQVLSLRLEKADLMIERYILSLKQ